MFTSRLVVVASIVNIQIIIQRQHLILKKFLSKNYTILTSIKNIMTKKEKPLKRF